MNKTEQLRKLVTLERKCDQMRAALNISRPGEVLYQAPQSRWSENDVVVEAVGNGEARLLVVEGNYPIDYLIKSERVFSSEDAACAAAESTTS